MSSDIDGRMAAMFIHPRGLVTMLLRDVYYHGTFYIMDAIGIFGATVLGMMSCLENLYDRVSPGGVIQIDDYGFWEGARKAVHDFFDRRSISPVLTRLDYSGRQFIKQ